MENFPTLKREKKKRNQQNDLERDSTFCISRVCVCFAIRLCFETSQLFLFTFLLYFFSSV